MSHGIIFKGIGGFFYVKYNDSIYECKARGKIKNDKSDLLVGDFVRISIQDEAQKLGMIEEVYERKNTLLRPIVANVDQAIVVFSIKNPNPNMTLLDKMLVLAENSGLDIVVCFNKSDLDTTFDFDRYSEIYTQAGYPVVKTCALAQDGIEELTSLLVDKISVFSGPSGVGKSSLLNAIEENFVLKTGALSLKISRGKHTTRHSELMELTKGGFVVDTPGFTSLSMHEIDPDDLSDFFPDFKVYSDKCRFDNCSHLNEPGCEVKQAILDKKIAKERYEAYLYIYNEIMEFRRKSKKW